MGHAIEPLIEPLGFDWKIGIDLLGAFASGAHVETIELHLTSMTAGVVVEAPELSERSGAFQFEAVKAGKCFLSAVIKRDGAFGQLGSEQFEPAHGKSRAFTLDYTTRELEVEERDDAGAVVAGAELLLAVAGAARPLTRARALAGRCSRQIGGAGASSRLRLRRRIRQRSRSRPALTARRSTPPRCS